MLLPQLHAACVPQLTNTWLLHPLNVHMPLVRRDNMPSVTTQNTHDPTKTARTGNKLPIGACLGGNGRKSWEGGARPNSSLSKAEGFRCVRHLCKSLSCPHMHMHTWGEWPVPLTLTHFNAPHWKYHSIKKPSKKILILFMFFNFFHFSFFNKHKWKNIWCMQISNIPNNWPTTGHLPFLVWGGVWATTGEQRPWNIPKTLRVLCRWLQAASV